MEYNKNKKNFREKGDAAARESSDGNVIVGRNPVLELLKSGRAIVCNATDFKQMY